MGQPMIGAGGVLLNLTYALIATRPNQPTISSGSAVGARTVSPRNQTRPTESAPDFSVKRAGFVDSIISGSSAIRQSKTILG